MVPARPADRPADGAGGDGALGPEGPPITSPRPAAGPSGRHHLIPGTAAKSDRRSPPPRRRAGAPLRRWPRPQSSAVVWSRDVSRASRNRSEQGTKSSSRASSRIDTTPATLAGASPRRASSTVATSSTTYSRRRPRPTGRPGGPPARAGPPLVYVGRVVTGHQSNASWPGQWPCPAPAWFSYVLLNPGRGDVFVFKTNGIRRIEIGRPRASRRSISSSHWRAFPATRCASRRPFSLSTAAKHPNGFSNE